MSRIAGDRHIGQAVKVIEDNAEIFSKNSFVVLLELLLRRRQVRADRIVDEIQDQIAVRLAIADLIETLQRANARIEGAFAALLVDIFLGIAGQRTN